MTPPPNSRRLLHHNLPLHMPMHQIRPHGTPRKREHADNPKRKACLEHITGLVRIHPKRRIIDSRTIHSSINRQDPHNVVAGCARDATEFIDTGDERTDK
jgi:hypothetical protein